MKWMLIYIIVNGGEPYAINAQGPRETFDTMYECFSAREILAESIGVGSGYFKPGQQAVCIKVEVNG